MTPSRCRIVASYDSGLSGWRCLSAGCGSWGLVKNGVLHESGTGKTLAVEFMTGPHDGVEGEQCRFDRSGDAFDGNIASAKPAPAPANSELDALRKTVTIPPRCRLVQDGGRGPDFWRCLSAGCASGGRTRNGILYEAGTGKQVVTGGPLPMELAFIGPHDGVVGEKCMFDSCHAAPGAPLAPPAPTASSEPVNTELEALRKTVERLDARVLALEFSVRKLQTWGNRY